MTRHLFIPDCQVKPGVNTDHIVAAANYAVSKKPDVIIMAGDFWDMPSLSSYEKKGSKFFEGRRILEDIKVGNDAMKAFMQPILKEQRRIRKNKKRVWIPRMVFLFGNHEWRIKRFTDENPQHDGLVSLEHLDLRGWEWYSYQVPVEIDGILYCHNFVNPDSLTKNILGGTIENKLSKIKRSFTCGHQQRRQFGQSYDGLGKELMGLVVGRFYSHDEHYMGPQGQHDWSGIVMKHEVKDGRYDPSFISMDYLVKHYGGST